MHNRGRAPEKVDDMRGTLIRLFKNLNKWRYLLILSVILAVFASIFSTIAPKKLASVTDIISEGLKPNIDNLEKLQVEMFASTNIDMSNKSSWKSEKEKIEVFNSLTDEDKERIFHDVEIDGILITSKDQVSFVDIMASMENDKELLQKLDEAPASIRQLLEPQINLKKLNMVALFLAIIYILNSIFSYIVGIIMAYVSNGYTKRLRMEIVNKINCLPLKFFDNRETGDILSIVANDVDTIGINMSNNITSLVSNTTLFLGSIIMMFVTNWIMALTAICSSLLGFIISFILLKVSQKYFVESQRELGKINGHIEEVFSGHNIVKAYNGEEEAYKEFQLINDRLYNCNRKSQFLSGIMQPIMGFIGNFGYVMVCIVGAILVMNNTISFGVIVAFMIYIRLFTNPLTRIAQAMTAIQSIAAASERVFKFMDEVELSSEDNIRDSLKVKEAKGNIEFSHVKFGYEEGKDVIKDFSANIKSGQKIAIVGPTGAGKTTIVNLLMKFYEINDGDIIIDGKSIKDLKRENIHDLFVMVLQDTWLFNGSIKENILYNQKKVSDEKIWEVCKTVGISHFIKTLPGSLNSMVDGSDSISSGQKQLLTIARGMMKSAPFLILDEATSNVDTRTEELVQKAMDKLMEGKTSFIIAHRLSTIKNADLILVMNEGNIIEQGNHDDLMKINGFYANLYNSQFQK